MQNRAPRSNEILARFLEKFGHSPRSADEEASVTSRVLSQIQSMEFLSLFRSRAKPGMAPLVEADELSLEDIKEAEDMYKRLARKGKQR